MYPDDEPIKVPLPEIVQENNEPPPEYENSKNCLLLSACVAQRETRKRCIKISSLILSFLLGFAACFIFTAILNTIVEASYVKCNQLINDDPDFYLRVQQEQVKELQNALENTIKEKQILQGKLNACTKNFTMTKNIFEEKFFKRARPDWIRSFEIRMVKAHESMEKEQARDIRRAIEKERKMFRNRIKDFVRTHQRSMDLQNNVIKRINDALRDSYKHPEHFPQNRQKFCDMFNTMVDRHMMFRVPNPIPVQMPMDKHPMHFPIKMIINE